MQERLPLSGKRWIAILLILLALIILGVIFSSVRPGDAGQTTGPEVMAPEQGTDQNLYGPGVAPAHPPAGGEGSDTSRSGNQPS
jgi:hypothetical protein